MPASPTTGAPPSLTHPWARALARVLTRDLAVKTKASRTDTHCLNGHRLAGDNLRISDARA